MNKSSKDWMEEAQSSLPNSVCARAYKQLAIELVAMEKSGINWHKYASSVPQLARLLTNILGWEVDYRKLHHRLKYCYLKHQDEVDNRAMQWQNE